jgi:hypothetical protein
MDIINADGFEGGSPSLMPSDVGALAVAEREKQEIQSAIAIAKRFPRNEKEAYTRAMKAMDRPRAAELARYVFPRGNKNITGPSVALAREIAKRWGNIRSGFRVVEITADFVHLKGYAHDLETNAYFEIEDRFERLVQRKVYEGSRGVTKWVSPDERDLRELINRRGALCERNCVLKAIPSDVIEDCLDAASETLRKLADKELGTNREETIRKLCLSFDRIGVSVSDLEDWLGNTVDQIDELQLGDLRGIFASIKDGQIRISDVFNAKKQDSAPKESSLNAIIGAPEETKEQKKWKKKDKSASDAEQQSNESSEATSVEAGG